MESVDTKVEIGGLKYDVLCKYRNGYRVLYQIDERVSPWCIEFPNGHINRFDTENNLWTYVIQHKLF